MPQSRYKENWMKSHENLEPWAPVVENKKLSIILGCFSRLQSFLMCFNNVDTELSFEGAESEACLECTEASLASQAKPEDILFKMIPTGIAHQSLLITYEDTWSKKPTTTRGPACNLSKETANFQEGPALWAKGLFLVWKGDWNDPYCLSECSLSLHSAFKYG